MDGVVVNVVICVLLQVISGILLPEGKMKKMSLSVVSLYMFYAILIPIVEFIELL